MTSLSSPAQGTRKKIDLFALFTGNILEHFDTAFTALLAPHIAALFFPNVSSLIALALFFFPLGFLAKPIGACTFGFIGDRYGKRKALYLSILGLSLSVSCMGILPTFQTFGLLSPILFFSLRALIHFFSTGERTGAALALLESCEEKNRGLMSSFYECSGMIGYILATVSIATLHHYELLLKYWRYFYLSGFLTGACAIYLRSRLPKVAPTLAKNFSFFPALKEAWKPFIAIILMVGFSYANYDIIIKMLHGTLMLESKFSNWKIFETLLFAVLFDALLFPIFGLLSKKFPKEWLMKISLTAVAILAIPLFLLLQNPTYTHIVSVRSVLILLGVCHASTLQYWIMSILPEKRRYTLMALAKALGAGLIGGPSVSLSLYLYEKTAWIGWPGIYITLCALGGLFGLRLLSSKKQQSYAHISS